MARRRQINFASTSCLWLVLEKNKKIFVYKYRKIKGNELTSFPVVTTPLPDQILTDACFLLLIEQKDDLV